MEIEVMEQFINSDCYTWKTSSPSTLLFTAYNKKYLELDNECMTVTINKKKICCSLDSVPLFLARPQDNLPLNPKLKVSVSEQKTALYCSGRISDESGKKHVFTPL